MVHSRGSDTQQEVQDRVHSSENEKEGEFGNDQGGPRGFNCQDVATDEKGAVGEMGLTRLWNLLRDSKDRLSDVAGCAQNVAAPPLEVGLRTGFSLRCR